uniref:Uncharacterized protein n=1 Tax=Arundo donax TaxID=35708 RepID=A0A0A9QIF7_ARUDO
MGNLFWISGSFVGHRSIWSVTVTVILTNFACFSPILMVFP